MYNLVDDASEVTDEPAMADMHDMNKMRLAVEGEALVMRGSDGKYYLDVTGSNSAEVLTPGTTTITSATSPRNEINTGAYADTSWTRLHGGLQVLGGIGGALGAAALMLTGAALTPETAGAGLLLSGYRIE
ncbi:hypothetical protein ACO0LF_04780 [Undibacterium sp. Di27W]|uniref:hypothetical protein n=1 Tax=Undibacterium sp. Di27W TaxID=3413036 RepID=UPI003BF24E9A